jgi:cysteinyl-tRNA synthetase
VYRFRYQLRLLIMYWKCAVLIVVVVARNSQAFTIPTPLSITTVGTAPSARSDQRYSFFATERDEYDDFYNDFDPSADYTDGRRYAQDAYSDRGRRGGADGFSAAGSHDYERDTSRDSSSVDLETVNSLIAARLQARKTGQFEEADGIRDDLLKIHGVSVWDREKTWRSGCSESGSGMRRSGGREQSSGRGDRGGRRTREPKDFGPLGHDYTASSDAGPVSSAITEDEIHALLAERLQYKMSRQFQDADRVQEQLLSNGVYVHDARKEWRADGVMFGDYANEGGKPSRERGSRSDRNRPYAQSEYSDGEVLTSEQLQSIENLLSRRSGAKQTRNYRVADDIRDELKNDFNVFIEDRLRQWSVGGDFGPDQPGFDDMNRSYTISAHSQPVTPADEALIITELEKRSEAKKSRDFETADAIRDNLMDNFNVAVNDRLREWSIGGEFGLPSKSNDKNRPFARRGGGDLSDEEVAIVTSLVEERDQAKGKRDFATADEIRDELEARFSVKVDDRSREWRVMSDDYVFSPLAGGDHGFDEDTIVYIQKQLALRLVHKTNRDYEAADEVRDELRDNFSISIDDRTREWSINVDEYSVVVDRPSQRIPVQHKQENGYGALEDSEIEDEVLLSAMDDFFNEGAIADEGESQSSSESVLVTGGNLESLTVAELKGKLKEAGLPVSGRKAELIERLSTA